MSGEHPHLPSPSERRVQEALRGLARPRAGEAFRTRLRHEFVTGGFGRRVPHPEPWRRRTLLLLPLAAGVLVVAAAVLNRGPDWRLVAANGEGRVIVNGAELTPRDASALSARLRRGGHVRVEGAATLDLVAPGLAAVALAPGADLVLSAAPGRWWGRGMRAHVASGDAYFTTGRAFAGARLDVSTPEARVEATGTAFAVLRAADFTCVCVLSGHVHVGRAAAPGEGSVDVPQGMRRVIHADGSSEIQPILEDSVHRLHAQQLAAGPQLGR